MRESTAPREVGSSSTRPRLTSEHPGETGVDTLRLLFETDRSFGGDLVEVDGWRFGSIPALGVTWAEGHPVEGALGSPDDVVSRGTWARDVVDDHLGVRRDRGVARVDVTTTRPFPVAAEARAFLAGMAALDLPRCHTIRRGRPAHSIAWAHERGRRLLARCYDKGLERGGQPWERVRLEEQARFASGRRPPLDAAADPEWQRRRFVRRFEPMRKAVTGVKAATFPVVAHAIADEARFGYRSAREAERLLGAMVLLGDGAGEVYTRSTRTRRRRELRDAGFVLVEDDREAVEVDLGEQLDRALDEFGA